MHQPESSISENMDSNEPKLNTRMEGANRCLSTVMVSLTAVVVLVLEFKEYMSLLVEHLEPKVAASFVQLILWIPILSIFSSFVTCTMCLNLNPNKKGWWKRATVSYCGLLVWDVCIIDFSPLVAGRGAKEQGLDYKLDGRDWRNVGYTLILFCVVIGVNVGFLCFPCWWHKKKKADIQYEKLPEASVVNGPCAQELRSYPVEIYENLGSFAESSASDGADSSSARINTKYGISNGSMAADSKALKERSLSRWDTTVFNMRWRDQSGPSGSVHIIERLQDNETPFYVKPILKAGNFFYNLWDAVREEEGKFRYSIWILSAAFISVLILFLAMISMILYSRDLVKKIETAANKALGWQDYIQKHVKEQDTTVPDMLKNTIVNVAEQMTTALTVLKAVIKENPHFEGHEKVQDIINRLQDMISSGAIKLLDCINDLVLPVIKNYYVSVSGGPKFCSSLTRILYSAIPTGCLLGTVIGFFAIYNVLRSHKRMSLMFAEEIRHHSQHGEGGSESWFGIEKKYPIGMAVYFLGVMTSTAVAQQIIFSVIISVAAAFVFNFEGYGYLMSLFGYKILFVVATIIVNHFFIKVYGSKFLTDGFRVKRVNLFFLYMCTFSMLHLVLGIYYAAFRIIGMVVTSLFVISRLDKTIFPVAGNFDNGHGAFMSMLVLTQAIQHNKQNVVSERKSQKSRKPDDGVGDVSSDPQGRSVDEPLLVN